MLYSADKFCQLTGINRQTLRHYVDSGLLIPSNIDDNNYKFYSEENALEVFYIKNHRGWDYSLKMISDNMYESPLEKQLWRIEEHEQHLAQRINELTMQLERTRKYKHRIESIHGNLNKIWEEDGSGPDIYRLLWIQKDKDKMESVKAEVRRWMKHYQYIFVAFSVDVEQLKDPMAWDYEVSLGIGMEEKLIKTSGIKATPHVSCFPARDNVQTILGLENPFSLTKQDLLPMLAYIKQKGYKIISDLSGRLLSCELKAGKRIYYFTLRISVKK